MFVSELFPLISSGDVFDSSDESTLGLDVIHEYQDVTEQRYRRSGHFEKTLTPCKHQCDYIHICRCYSRCTPGVLQVN